MNDMPTIWTYVKADALFNDLLPEVPNYKRKIQATNTNGAPIDFSAQEKEAINQALKQITLLYHWRYIKAERFFPVFLPELKNYKKKIVGKNTRGNPLAFTETELKDINNAIEKLVSNYQIK